MFIHRAVLGLILAAGCSKGGDSPKDNGKVASCNMPSMQSCREYRGGNLALGTENLAKLCDIGGFALAETPCPTVGVIGVCSMKEGTDFFYTGYAIPMADAEKSCTSGGHTFHAK